MINTEYIRSLNANYERMALGERTETGGKEISVLYDQPGRNQGIAPMQPAIY